MATLYVAFGRAENPVLRVAIPVLADTERAAWVVADALCPRVEDWQIRPSDQVTEWERVPAFEYARQFNDGRPYDAEALIAEATRWFLAIESSSGRPPEAPSPPHAPAVHDAREPPRPRAPGAVSRAAS